MACDICGKKGGQLNDLITAYKTDEVQQVCDDCERDLNEHLGKLRSVTHNILVSWMKRFISEKARRPA